MHHCFLTNEYVNKFFFLNVGFTYVKFAYVEHITMFIYKYQFHIIFMYGHFTTFVLTRM